MYLSWKGVHTHHILSKHTKHLIKLTNYHSGRTFHPTRGLQIGCNGFLGHFTLKFQSETEASVSIASFQAMDNNVYATPVCFVVRQTEDH